MGSHPLFLSPGTRARTRRRKRPHGATDLRHADPRGQEWKAKAAPVSNHQPAPASSARAIQIPETEARRAKLYTPAWVIVDEFNSDDLATSWAVEDANPLGQFSRKFMSRIASEAAAAIRVGVTRSVPRR